MTRQATTPIDFPVTRRIDSNNCYTSGRAGVVVPVDYIPLFPGDGMSGALSVNVKLAEMPKPLMNAVAVKAQAWVVPREAFPQFSGADDVAYSFHGEDITTSDGTRTPPPFFNITTSGTDVTTCRDSEFYKTLGVHLTAGYHVNHDVVDAYCVAYNFRLRAHSNRLARVPYAAEDLSGALTLQRAFWNKSAFDAVVPDYEAALVVGSLGLDVQAGNLPIISAAKYNLDGGTHYAPTHDTGSAAAVVPYSVDPSAWNWGAQMFAEMAGQNVTVSLANIDVARKTQAFARLRTRLAGLDGTGFTPDDAIIAHLMRGLTVPEAMFKRPWLAGQAVQGVGFYERFATEAAALDQSVTTGDATLRIPLNVPKLPHGGIVIVTMEVVPQRIYERQGDPYLEFTDPVKFPDALRDTLRTTPVDTVVNRRVDARHTNPGGVYGYEPMNNKHRRNTTRLGGIFYQAVPGTPVTESRMGLWAPDVIDPNFTDDHFLVPDNFTHAVFADTLAPAFEATVRRDCVIVGLTQFGDPLVEDDSAFTSIMEETA